MPAPISAPAPVDALVKRVEKAGNAFSQRAVELSNAIEAIAQRLELMNGKLAVQVSVGDITVSFGKPGGHWGLFLNDADLRDNSGNDDAIEPLLSVSILRKAKAFGPLLKLLEEIEAEQKRQFAIVDSALAALGTPKPLATPQSLLALWRQACDVVGGLLGNTGKLACSASLDGPTMALIEFNAMNEAAYDLCGQSENALRFEQACSEVLGHPIALMFALRCDDEGGKLVPPPPKTKLPPPPRKAEGK